MNSFSLYTIPLICVLLVGSFNLSGQSQYYSKAVGGYSEVVVIYDAVPLEAGSALISLYNNNQEANRSKFGWIVINNVGEQIDSFFYKEDAKLSDQGHTLMLLGDTVLQLATNTTDRKVLSVHGSSYSHKDSIFRWQYDFTDIPGIHLVLGQSVHLNNEGNIVIMGIYGQAEPGASNWLVNVYLVELSREGDLLRRTKVTEIREHTNANYVRVTSRILEKDNAYYVAIQRENTKSQYIIIKLDKTGELIWSQDGDFGSYGGFRYTMPELFLSKDSSRLQVIHCMAEDYSGYEDHVADSLWLLYGYNEIVLMREYDVESGERLSHYEKPIYDAGIATYGAAKSSVTGEIVFGGNWSAWDDADTPDFYNGFVGKITEEGTFSNVYRVMDEFGHPFVRGEILRGVIELSTGDFLFYGDIKNGQGSGGPGWLMKLPLSICFEGAYCEGDTLSLHTILTSTNNTKIGPYKALQLHPNPTSLGQSIYLAGFPHEGYTGAIRLRLLDLQGRVVHKTSLIGVHADSIRWELPVSLRSGVYLIEMTTAGGAAAGGKIMVVGE